MKTSSFNPLMLGTRIKKIRIQQGLSIEKLAEKSDVNKNTVVRLEKGRPTQPRTIYNVCDILGVSPLELMDNKLQEGQDYQFGDFIEEAVNPDLALNHIYRFYRLPGGEINATILEIEVESEWQSHPGEKLLYALTGDVGIRLGQSEDPQKLVDIKLREGKAACFWAAEPHQYYNPNKDKEV